MARDRRLWHRSRVLLVGENGDKDMGVSFNWVTDSIAGLSPIASPDRTALAFEDQASVSYRELRATELRYATALQQAGVTRGDRVAILMRNSLDYLLLTAAIARAGAISVRLNWRLIGPELQFLLTDSGSKVLVLDNEFGTEINGIREYVPVQTYVVRREPGDTAGVPAWATSLDAFGNVDAIGQFPELTLDDPATIMYTSGTTGLPKGAVLTHGNWFWVSTIQTQIWQIDAESVVQVGGPMFHAAAWEIMVLPALLHHAKGVFSASGGFSLERFFELGRKHGTTHIFVYSHMLYELARRDDLEEIVPKTLRRIVAGGDTVMPWVYEEFRKRLPGVRIDQTYGLTEGGMVNTLLRHEDAAGHESSVGKPNPLTEIKLLTEDGRRAAVGEEGEIYTRSPAVSVGYWRRPEASAESFVDGWCRTGDLGRVDQDGFLTLAGRAKDMVRSGGENIYPVEIEKVLTGLAGIGDAAVVGVPDAKYVEVGCAVLVAEQGQSIDVDAVRAHCAERLAKFKIPKYFVVVDDLPRTPTGKVLKRVLREQYASLGESAMNR
jgi:fatty-acyl-CoA synthase